MKLLIDGLDRLTERSIALREKTSYDARYSAEKAIRRRIGEDAALVFGDLQYARRSVERLRQEAGGLKALVDAAREQAHYKAEYEIEQLKQVARGPLVELLAALGVPADASRGEITSALRRALRAVDRDAEVERLRCQIGAFERAVKQLDAAPTVKLPESVGEA